MARTKISEFSATANSNTDINSINIAEGCAPSNINDAIRELMAELKDFQAGTKGDSFNGPVGSTTAAAGAFTTLSSTGNTTLGDASGDTVTINGTATFANANPTLSAGTANGVLYLNGSKVATSGSALTFDGTNFALGAGGDIRAYNTANTRYGRFATTADGTVLESFNGAGEPLILSAPQSTAYIGFKVNGSEQARINTTGLGIGTSSPSQRLHVTGSSSATTVGTAATIQITSSTGLSAPAGDVYLQAVIDSATAGDRGTALVFQTGRTAGIAERARIDSLGNLGLGVTPTNAYTSTKSFEYQSGGIFPRSGEINFTFNATQNSGASWIYGATNSASLFQIKPASFVWQIAGSGTAGNAISFTQAMTLDASGNLGVGTSSPTNTAGYQTIEVNGSSGGIVRASYSTTVKGYYFANSAGVTLGSESNDALMFRTNATERARITSGGSLFIGTTNIGYTRLFGVESSGDVAMIKTTGSATSTPLELWNVATSGDNRFEFFYTEASPTARGSIDYNRGAGLTRYNTTSDATLKNIIGDSDGVKSVEILKSTRIREYSWKEDQSNKTQVGVIAQELYETFKGAVSVGGDKVNVDEEGNETTQYIPWAVDKTAFTFHLVAGWQAHERIIQEQQVLIEQLKARLDAANL